MQTHKIQVRGQYYWQNGRSKDVSAFGYAADDKVFVEVPDDQLHRALSYIQNVGIGPVLKARNDKAVRFRVCEIVGEIPKQIGSYQNNRPLNEVQIADESFPMTAPDGPTIVPEPGRDTGSTEESEFPTSTEEVEDENTQPTKAKRETVKAGK